MTLEQAFKTLDLKRGSSVDDIKRTYKDLVNIWHPDRVHDDNPRLKEKATDKIKEINIAYKTLMDYFKNKPIEHDTFYSENHESTASSTSSQTVSNQSMTDVHSFLSSLFPNKTIPLIELLYGSMFVLFCLILFLIIISGDSLNLPGIMISLLMMGGLIGHYYVIKKK